MKLAIVRQRYNPFGGAERFVERALAALDAKGLRVTLITRAWQGAAGRDVRICNPFHLGRWWRDAGFARAVQRLIATREFDLVQSHERIPGCDIFRAGDGLHVTWLELRGQTQSRLERCFTRWHPWHRYTLAAEAAMLRHPALQAVICNSHMVRHDIMQRFNLPAERLHVIHNGVDLDHFHPGLRTEHRHTLRAQLDIADNVPVILFVGSGFERKGVAQLLQALAILPTRAHLVVVGKDKKQATLQKRARKLGLQERVHFVGGQKDVRPWYGMADVFALPTLYDPFPNVVLEALACGLPVVTSTTSGAAEVLTDRTCGGICQAHDITTMAAHLERLLNTPPAQASQAARALVAPLGQADMGRQLEALYLRLIGARQAV